MPLCTTCNAELCNAAFTKGQLQRARRSGTTPTCKSCQDLQGKEGPEVIAEAHSGKPDKIDGSGLHEHDNFVVEKPVQNTFVVTAIPGKGMGVVASCSIARGTLLLLEAPLVLGDGAAFSSAAQRLQAKMIANPNHSIEEAWDWKKTEYEHLLMDVFARLPSAEQSEVMEMYDSYQTLSGGKTLTGIWFSNSLPCGPDANTGMLCRTACRFNSSCTPNAMYSWVESLGKQQVRAIRDIDAGEELCVCYIDPRNTTAIRQADLAKFNFACTCELCIAADASSDANRARIQKLDDTIGRCGATHPELALKMVGELVALHELERITIPEYMGRLMNDAFQISVAAGKPKAVLKGYAEKAYDLLLVGYGAHDQVAQMMKHFAANPPKNPHEMVRVQMEMMG